MHLTDEGEKYSSSSSSSPHPPLPPPLSSSINMAVITPSNVLVLGQKVLFSLAFNPIPVPVTPVGLLVSPLLLIPPRNGTYDLLCPIGHPPLSAPR